MAESKTDSREVSDVKSAGNARAEMNELTYKLTVDVSEALTALKAIQREARKATAAVAELQSLSHVSTSELVYELTGRGGVEEYEVGPHGCCAKLVVYNDDLRTYPVITGPARILVVTD